MWPTLEQHFHWADNTGNIRLRRPDAGSTTLHEVRCGLRGTSALCLLRWLSSMSAAGRAVQGQPQHSVFHKCVVCLQHVRASAHGHTLPPGCAASDLLSQLLTYDPARRCTAQAALRHPYFLEVISPKQQNSPWFCSCTNCKAHSAQCQLPHAHLAALSLQEPLPGPNAFRHKGQVTRYPRRARATDGMCG